MQAYCHDHGENKTEDVTEIGAHVCKSHDAISRLSAYMPVTAQPALQRTRNGDLQTAVPTKESHFAIAAIRDSDAITTWTMRHKKGQVDLAAQLFPPPPYLHCAA